MKSNPTLVYLIGILLLTSCGKEESSSSQDPSTLFTLLDTSKTGIDFENTLVETEDENVMTYEYIYNGGGVAVGDINNDGLADVYLAGNQVKNKLFLNKGGFRFEDITTLAAITEKDGWKTGTAMADVNGDGLLDIYVCYSGNAPQEGFTQPVIRDYKPRANQLFINQGVGKDSIPVFKDQAKEYGLDAIGTFTTQVYFLDYDLDGDLDVFLLNHANKFYNIFFNVTMLRSKRHPYYGNKLYENRDNKFVEVSEEAGINGTGINFGLSASISDLNKDGYPDIFVTNDYSEQDFCYLNNGDGTFTETSKKSFEHFSKYSMGSDVADINNDSNPDLFVVDMLPEDNYRQKVLKGPDEYNKSKRLIDSGYHPQYMHNNLHLSKGLDPQGDLRFTEVAQLSGISNTDWSWAPLVADYDNDGFKDIFITNGYLRDYSNLDFNNYTVHEANARAQATGEKLDMGALISKIPSTKVSNYIYKNVDGLLFENKTKAWGLDKKTVSNAAAYADLDNDGDLDLIINNLNDPVLVYENRENEQLENNFLSLTLKGEAKNTQALGAKVMLQLEDGKQIYQEAYFVRGYQSSVEPKMTIGLGKAETIQNLEVIWPSKKLTRLEHVQANQTLILKETEATETYDYNIKPGEGFFTEITANSNIDFKHQENDYVDYNYESLIPYQLSKTSGKASVGDVNNDGNDDIFFLGASGQTSQLYLGTDDGKFKLNNTGQPWTAAEDLVHEDYDALFFDADGDGDLDLYVVSGGNEEFNGDAYYQDRLYLNSGSGKFSKAENALPDMKFSGGVVKAADFDKDGDLDLFVGGRISGGNYPMSPRSTLLRNESTKDEVKFVPVRNYDLQQLGMVTDADWVDIDNDSWPDLVLAGEWMPISIFKNTEGTLKNVTQEAGLADSNGWWFSLQSGDFDGDGDIDLLAGNLGENNQFKASVEEPMRYYIQDIDNNGRIDPILTYYIDGVSYPWPTRDELMGQVSALKKQYKSYESYAKTNTDEFLKTNNIEPRFTLEIKTLASAFIENNGDGTFSIKALPKPVQDAPIQDFVYTDFDGDGQEEVLAAGNLYPFRVSQGPLDASFGSLLSFKDGNFILKPQSANLWLDGDIKSLQILKFKSGKQELLLTRNNDSPGLYTY
ncbi:MULTISPECIES: VCBS repeat-containing protein [unclassified Leeuwenhoekiella]|uniref:VCBS repeat-containing protein n=1 Tax=unclassified Leeuwenhoekiella TaxID=2615029 RepID=UPI000C350CDE|nr:MULTISPECIES: VCBS repeat-containing protein [unclassified Leeuwenhoekiella]MAW94674.1 type IV secretion protein Rhs [Leeuwenhoekiella sp.]MBA82097.1 type IV secretion protein Rhs [Leeuwenhoekiella sp.]|tara:strand:- start:4554 stop:7946 length:3393 start_codon:yes stop_codon:yes gene_type:complete